MLRHLSQILNWLYYAASGMPTVRKKMLEHVMVWFTRCKTSLDEPTFKCVKVKFASIRFTNKYIWVVPFVISLTLANVLTRNRLISLLENCVSDCKSNTTLVKKRQQKENKMGRLPVFFIILLFVCLSPPTPTPSFFIFIYNILLCAHIYILFAANFCMLH